MIKFKSSLRGIYLSTSIHFKLNFKIYHDVRWTQGGVNILGYILLTYNSQIFNNKVLEPFVLQTD